MCCSKLTKDQIVELLLITRLKDPPKDLRTELLLTSALKKLREALEKKQKRRKRKYRGIKMKIEEKKDYSSIPEEKIDTEDLLGLNNFFTDLKTVSSSDTAGQKFCTVVSVICLEAVFYDLCFIEVDQKVSTYLLKTYLKWI
ncbi:uncharacterized protein TNCT_306131 [Trichonephila clavata]|uniref:Uncharacterized protein n=1 Tax=Trichonephila clavata TaxID=2740835 RepID=A0A8X6H5F0_TRICU|nr:uncharacterized protein TNCT_306131 [Trichonephila clavata]